MRGWLKALPLGLGLPVIIGAASVKPEDAASNLAAWLHLLGVEHVPLWLQSPAADKQVVVGSLIAGAVYAFVAYGIPLIKGRTDPKSPDNQWATLAVAGPRRNRASTEFDKWRVAVHTGSIPASNVKVRLINISPRPRSAEWRAEYPYPIVRAEQTLDAPAAEINPGDSEDYDAVPASRSATGQLFVHLNTKNLSDPRIPIEPDERWELHFEVTARNADAIQFMLVVYVDDGIVQVVRGRK